MRKIIAAMLFLSVCAFLYQSWRIASIREEIHVQEQQHASLAAEVEEMGKWPRLAMSFAKSMFDGFTFGKFAEEGTFTEYNKADRRLKNIAVTEAALLKANEQSLIQLQESKRIRTWSMGIGGVAMAILCFWRPLKRGGGESAGGGNKSRS